MKTLMPNLKIVFDPSVFLGFTGSQEELNEMVTAISQSIESELSDGEPINGYFVVVDESAINHVSIH